MHEEIPSRDDIEFFSQAYCAIFAAVLSELMGYEIVLRLFDGPVEGDKYLCHAFCRSGEFAIDVEGIRPLEEMIERWKVRGGLHETFSLKTVSDRSGLGGYSKPKDHDDIEQRARAVVGAARHRYVT